MKLVAALGFQLIWVPERSSPGSRKVESIHRKGSRKVESIHRKMTDLSTAWSSDGLVIVEVVMADREVPQKSTYADLGASWQTFKIEQNASIHLGLRSIFFNCFIELIPAVVDVFLKTA